MTHICNVKISVLVCSNLYLTSFIEIANKRKLVFTLNKNILVIKDTFSITVFKKNKNKYHINITGIKSTLLVDSVIDWLIDSYCSKEFFYHFKV